MDLWEAVLQFGILTALLAITPGLDTVLVLRQVLRGGRGPAWAASLGVGLGTLVWGVAAAAGLTAILMASQWAYQVLHWAGVGFLCWLGISYLRQAWRGTSPSLQELSGPADSAAQAFTKGLLTNLLNPKMAAFYLTVLPLFLPAGYPPVLAGALLAGLHVSIAMVWFGVIILAGGQARRFLATPTGTRAVDATAGVAMIGFGVTLGLDR